MYSPSVYTIFLIFDLDTLSSEAVQRRALFSNLLFMIMDWGGIMRWGGGGGI